MLLLLLSFGFFHLLHRLSRLLLLGLLLAVEVVTESFDFFELTSLFFLLLAGRLGRFILLLDDLVFARPSSAAFFTQLGIKALWVVVKTFLRLLGPAARSLRRVRIDRRVLAWAAPAPLLRGVLRLR